MKTFFVVNPQSANGSTGRRWGELASRLARAMGEFEVGFTAGPMDAAQLAARALERGFDCIVAVGGDGTMNEVLNGFFKDGRPVNPSATLAVLPRGTGGDFRRTFGWDTDFDAAVRRLHADGCRPLDVGLLEYTSHTGRTERRYFGNICSFGVSGLVDEVANTTSKVLGGTISFMWASVKALARYRDQRVRISFDGRPAETLEVTTVAVANGKYFGGGMKVAPEADVSDGLFDVTIWSGYGLSDFVVKGAGLYSGAHARWKGTRTLRCRCLTVEAESRVLLDCDGEQPGQLPCRMELLPGAISLKG